jgi:hypothetical protein
MSTSLRHVAALAATTLALVGAVSVAAPAQAVKPTPGTSTGTARIFMVNPVQSTGDESLTDDKDADSAVPAAAYASVSLRNLDGSGYLRGTWVTVQSATGTPAFSPTNAFFYTRHDDRFEQVMAYFWVDQAQEYLRSLGFDGVHSRAIVDQPLDVKIDQFGGDNSYQTDKPYRLRFGKGGVDDAEDAEVIVHEYGHAVHQSQVPGFGASVQAGSIGEAWGDYLAVTVGLDAAAANGWPVLAPADCPMDWDSTSYTAGPIHCIRSFHTGMTVADTNGEVHHDGQIWSQGLWEIRQGYAALGLSSRAWDTTLVQSQFDYAPDTSFDAAASATYRVALARDGQAAAALVRDRFAARGIVVAP